MLWQRHGLVPLGSHSSPAAKIWSSIVGRLGVSVHGFVTQLSNIKTRIVQTSLHSSKVIFLYI